MAASNSSRIARNTVYLYLRSLIVLGISLYSSRLILQVLGASDFGLYNVVGGVVTMLSFLTTAMQASYQRYYAYAMGEGNMDKVLHLFHCSLTVQTFLAIFILIIAETIGLYFLNAKMVIEPDRMVAANWVYQTSVISFVLIVVQAPFTAIVTSNERMDLFAYVSVYDAVLKLIIIYLVKIFGGDNLIVYAILMLLISVSDLALYVYLCTMKLNISSIKLGKDKQAIKNLASFGGWGTMDSLAYTLKSNGLNIVINIFFGTVVNAARGIAYQVLSAVNQFIFAFQNSFRPQMTKSYAAGDFAYLKRIYYSCTKLSYYLIITISLPILLETPYILHLWLGDVPEHTVAFTRLVIITTFVSAFANPTSGVAYSAGKIKWFTILVSSVYLLIVPVAYFFLRMGYPAESSMVVSLVLTVIAQIIRLFVVRNIASMSIREYMKMVVLPTAIYSILTPLIPLFIQQKMPNQSFVRLLVVTIICVTCSLCFAWFFGLNKSEKFFIRRKISGVIKNNLLK